MRIKRSVLIAETAKALVKYQHFFVSRVAPLEQLLDPIVSVEVEAVFSKATQVIPWRELQGDGVWRQGWV